LFAAGLLVQLFAPHLKVENRAFVIPPELAAGEETLRPDEIVGKERRMQLISAVLTLSGALGLAFRHREVLFRGASREIADRPERESSSSSSLGGRRRPEVTTENPETTTTRTKELVT